MCRINYNRLKKVVGLNIKKKRLEKNLSVLLLSQRVNIPIAILEEIENGENDSNFTLLNILRITECFDIRLEDLYNGYCTYSKNYGCGLILPDNFFEYINYVVESKGWSIRHLANVCGFSLTAWSNWRNGIYIPCADYLQNILCALNIKEIDLRNNCIPMFSSNTKSKKENTDISNSTKVSTFSDVINNMKLELDNIIKIATELRNSI